MMTAISQVSEYQAQCQKLPKALRTWPAYSELKNRIDDFGETMPILVKLSSPAIKERHWKQVITICAITIDNYLFGP